MALPDTNRYIPKTSQMHYPVPTGMFQKQTYGTIRYQLVRTKNMSNALFNTNQYVPKTSLWHYPDTNQYVPKTNLWHYPIPTSMFQKQTYVIS